MKREGEGTLGQFWKKFRVLPLSFFDRTYKHGSTLIAREAGKFRVRMIKQNQ
jgi:hypothetical protein